MRYHSKISKIYCAVGSFILVGSNKTYYHLIDRLGRRKGRYGATNATANVHGIVLYGMYSIDCLSR